MTGLTQSGYTRQADGRYLQKSLPRLDLEYTAAVLDDTVRDLSPESLQNLPRGVDGDVYQWLDLDSEGLPGVLTEQRDCWYYKRNLGGGVGADGACGGAADLRSRRWLAGGSTFSTSEEMGGWISSNTTGAMPGFQERAAEPAAGGGSRHSALRPQVDRRDPNLRFIDVTGDGFPDILVSEDSVFTWYESRAEAGFAPARRTPKSWDEEQGPTQVFADPDETIFLADMSGDGLSDILRIRYGEVCYWPNLGYGRFGAKVTMDNAPVFDSYDRFDPRRIRLADIDGSGTTDILYIGQDGVTLHFNQSGNSWAAPYRLTQFPRIDDVTSIAVADLKGSGTACLVWSSAPWRPMGGGRCATSS